MAILAANGCGILLPYCQVKEPISSFLEHLELVHPILTQW